MNLQVGPKPYTLVESLEIPLKGPLKEPLQLPMNLQVLSIFSWSLLGVIAMRVMLRPMHEQYRIWWFLEIIGTL